VQNFRENRLGEPSLCRVLNARLVAKYSDVGHVENYISETVQDTASGTINHFLIVSVESNVTTLDPLG